MAEKGIKTVWIDSDSVGVLGTKVYRDDVLIATVPFGTLFYNDPTAVEGVQYKYEVQAYTSESESTDETLGVNMDYYEIAETTNELRPILTNFRIEDNDNRLYFDSSKIITGSTYNGFTISNKTINGISINAGQTTGHYLTVTSGFNFWDNMTIRYDGSNNIVDGNSSPVYPFNLQDVDNQIPQPIGSGNIYYVTTSGDNGNDGESEGQAWRTLAYADGQLGAGDTLYVKAGNYGDDKMYFKNSSGGTVDEPILISGYQTTPGDITSNYYDYGVSMSSSEMPMVVGGTAVTRGVELTATDYFIIENMQWSGYRYGIYMDNSSTAANNMTFNRCNFTLQGDGTTDGYGFYSTGINNTKITINDCRFFDASHSNCVIMGNNNAIYDTKAYAERTDSDGDLTMETDYHYVISGQFNKAIRSHAEHKGNIDHAGHGFSLKNQYYTIDSSYKVEYCLIDDCTVTHVNGALELRHNSVKYNYVNNLLVDGGTTGGRGNGFVIRDGASYNVINASTVRNINTNDDWTGFLYFKNSSEDGTSGITMTDNVIQNCLFHTGATGEYAIVWGRNAGSEYAFTASETKFYNNTFKGIPNLQYKATLTTVTGTVWENNIFDSVSSLGTDTGGSWDYNLFYNGFAAQGTNPITVDPDLDANYQPQATFTDIDVPKISGINYGKNGNERQDDTTVGSILSASELPEQPPVEEYDFYVSATGTGDGLTSDTPMSLASAEATTLTAGQSMAFKGGDEFFGQFDITGTGSLGNEILYTSYGTGKAIFKSSVAKTFADQGSNVWSSVEANPVYQVFKNGAYQQNAKSIDYTMTSVQSTTQFTCSSLIGHDDIVGATIFARNKVYFESYARVSAFNSSTGQVTLTGGFNNFSAVANAPFNIVNHLSVMDTQDEWVYDSGVLYIYSTTTPTQITAAIGDTDGFFVENAYIDIDNIEIRELNNVGIRMNSASNVRVTNCNLINCYSSAISAYGGGSYVGATITDNYVSGSNQWAIYTDYNNSVVSRNTVETVGVQDYYTYKSTYSGVGIRMDGDNAICENNRIDNMGYNGINFAGLNSSVKWNYITNFNNYLIDGAAIYTFSADWDNPTSQFSEVLYNTIIGDSNREGEGVYLDNKTQDVTVRYNYMESTKAGVYSHDNRNCIFEYNNIYKSKKGFSLVEDTGHDGDVYGNQINYNNIYINDIPSYTDATLINHNSYFNNIGLYTGDNNVWWNYNSLSSLFSITNNGSTRTPMTLAQYRTYTGQETNSVTNTEITGATDLDFGAFNETAVSKVVSLPDGDTWYEIRSNTPYTTNITLGAYESMILIKPATGE